MEGKKYTNINHYSQSNSKSDSKPQSFISNIDSKFSMKK